MYQSYDAISTMRNIEAWQQNATDISSRLQYHMRIIFNIHDALTNVKDSDIETRHAREDSFASHYDERNFVMCHFIVFNVKMYAWSQKYYSLENQPHPIIEMSARVIILMLLWDFMIMKAIPHSINMSNLLGPFRHFTITMLQAIWRAYEEKSRNYMRNVMDAASTFYEDIGIKKRWYKIPISKWRNNCDRAIGL